MRRIALLAALMATQAMAQNADFRINNGLPIAINEVYVSSSGEAAWGSDLMGDRVLRRVAC